MSAITGPIAPYSNVPIHINYYQPRLFIISAITLGFTTIITTSTDHDYTIGQQVYLIIPPGYGCRQLNNQFAYVLSIPASNQVEINIDSLGFDSFIIPSSSIQQAQISGVGDINQGAINASGVSSTQTYIDGSFINISPN